MRRALAAFAVACALIAGPPRLSAQSIVISGTNTVPDQIEQLGFSTSYMVQGITPGYPYTIVWSGLQTDAVNGDTMQKNDTGNVFDWSIPGEFDIQAVVTYSANSQSGPPQNPPPPPPPQPATVKRHVSIKKPELASLDFDTSP